MIQSSQPRKQRYFRANAPMHVRQNFVNVHISKDLAKRLGIKKRSIEVRKGDTVKIMSGDSRGKSGKVTSVNLKTSKVLIEGVSRRNAKNKELLVPIHASNLYITDLDISDKLRAEEVGKKAEKKAAEEKKTDDKAEAKAEAKQV